MEEINDKVLLSICCTTYNHEKYIKYTLEGFLEQKTDFKYEILIHDDASNDKTAEIIKEYEKKYPNLIKVIYQKENQYSKGKAVSTFLYEQAQGKYLAFCEGDDFWIDKNKLQKQVDFLEKNKEYSAVYHNVLVVDEENKRSKLEQKAYPIFEEHNININDIKIRSVGGQTASIVARNFWNDFSNEDKDVYIKTKANGDNKLALVFVCKGKVKYFSDIMSCYRRSYTGDSWNARNKDKNLVEFDFNSKIELKNFVQKIFKKEFDVEFSKYLYQAFVCMLKVPTKENIQIFFRIFKKLQNKKKASSYVLKAILKKIKNKISKTKKRNQPYWPLANNEQKYLKGTIYEK